MTHTFAELELSPAAYDEIRQKLQAAGYDHAFMEDGALDMHGIGVTREKVGSSSPNDLPRYQCIKIVQALEIDSVVGETMYFIQPRQIMARAKPGMFTRYTPVKGDFLVIYEDGYESVSPRTAFLKGYVRIEE